MTDQSENSLRPYPTLEANDNNKDGYDEISWGRRSSDDGCKLRRVPKSKSRYKEKLTLEADQYNWRGDYARRKRKAEEDGKIRAIRQNKGVLMYLIRGDEWLHMKLLS